MYNHNPNKTVTMFRENLTNNPNENSPKRLSLTTMKVAAQHRSKPVILFFLKGLSCLFCVPVDDVFF